MVAQPQKNITPPGQQLVDLRGVETGRITS